MTHPILGATCGLRFENHPGQRVRYTNQRILTYMFSTMFLCEPIDEFGRGGIARMKYYNPPNVGSTRGFQIDNRRGELSHFHLCPAHGCVITLVLLTVRVDHRVGTIVHPSEARMQP